MKKNIQRVIFIASALIFIVIFYLSGLNKYFTYENIKEVRAFILRFSMLAPLIIICLFVILNLFGIPNVFFVFLSGYLYGLVNGLILAYIGTILGFTLSFIAIRYFFRDIFIKKYKDKKIIKWIEDYTEEYGGWSVLFFRVIFAIPYSAQNIAYALTSISFIQYFIMSVIGSIPQTVVFVYLGFLLSCEAISVAQFRNIFIVIVAVISIIASAYFTFLLLKSRKKKNKKFD